LATLVHQTTKLTVPKYSPEINKLFTSPNLVWIFHYTGVWYFNNESFVGHL